MTAYFPAGTRLSVLRGSMCTRVAPDMLFSNSPRYDHFMRLHGRRKPIL